MTGTATDADAIAEAIELLKSNGYMIQKVRRPPLKLPEREVYAWQGMSAFTFAAHRRDPTVVRLIADMKASDHRSIIPLPKLSVLAQAVRSVLKLDGEYWELGVYRGTSARLITQTIRDAGRTAPVRLFDTFEGMPETNPDKDFHRKGDFADTSLAYVRRFVGDLDFVSYQKGLIPESFTGLEDAAIRFAHIDLDIYDPILAGLEFIWPRMKQGVIVFDDYGSMSCPGARAAVDSFFRDKPEEVLTLTTGQALVYKL